MFDINKLDEEARRFYDEIPQIARDAMQKSGARFTNLHDLQDYYYNYVHGFDNVLYQNTPDTNSDELDSGDSYALVNGDPENFDLAGAGEDEKEYIKDNT